MFTPTERRYLATARVGRLGTADSDGRPSVVPVCFALLGTEVVTPIDEKPMAGDPQTLRRVRDVRANPAVSLVVDHYDEDWSSLGWVQVRGTATVSEPAGPGHGDAVTALRAKYDQYADHDLESRPVILVDVGRVVSWGTLRRTTSE